MPTPLHVGFTAPTVGIFKNQGGVTIGHPNIINRLISHPITSLLINPLISLQQAVAGMVEDLVLDQSMPTT
nr:hypothetical protein [Pseudomonas gingeri]